MLRTRLWMGALLIGLTVGCLVVDRRWAPVYPFLLALLVALAGLACWELWRLLPPPGRPPAWLCGTGVLAVVLANWPAHVGAAGDPWHWVVGTFAAVALAAFLVEMATYRAPGESVTRIARTVWLVTYLGLLPCF